MTRVDDDLLKKQNNTLPPDLIANDRYVDDVLWNGPRSGSRIQRAGGIVIGGTLLLCGLAAVGLFYQLGARLLLAPFLAIAAGGTRILYKALVRGKQAKRLVDSDDVS
jgi:hypothetical protein